MVLDQAASSGMQVLLWLKVIVKDYLGRISIAIYLVLQKKKRGLGNILSFCFDKRIFFLQ